MQIYAIRKINIYNDNLLCFFLARTRSARTRILGYSNRAESTVPRVRRSPHTHWSGCFRNRSFVRTLIMENQTPHRSTIPSNPTSSCATHDRMPHPSSEMERTGDRQVEGRLMRPTGYQISLVPQSVPNIVNCSRNLIPRPGAVMQRRGIRSRDTSQTSMKIPCKLEIVLFSPGALRY